MRRVIAHRRTDRIARRGGAAAALSRVGSRRRRRSPRRSSRRSARSSCTCRRARRHRAVRRRGCSTPRCVRSWRRSARTSTAPTVARWSRSSATCSSSAGCASPRPNRAPAGCITSRLTDVPGSSRYVDQSVVTYANDAKTELLGVPPELHRRHTAPSASRWRWRWPTACERARGVDVGVGVTGIAGPGGGTPEKPVGTGRRRRGHARRAPLSRVFRFFGEREQVKFQASQAALDMVRRDAVLVDVEVTSSCACSSRSRSIDRSRRRARRHRRPSRRGRRGWRRARASPGWRPNDFT